MILPLVDAILAGAPAGVTKDGTGAEPIEAVADRLYAWPVSEQLREEGAGHLDESRFVLGMLLTVGSLEAAGGETVRATSDALDSGTDAIAAWVRANRADTSNPPLWEDLQVTAIGYGGRGFEYRAARLTLAGYRQIS